MDTSLPSESNVLKQHCVQLLNINNTDYSLILRVLIKPTIGTNSQRSGGAQRSHWFFMLFSGNRKFPSGHFSLCPLNNCWILNEFDCSKWSPFKILTVVYFPQRGASRVLAFSLWPSLTSTSHFSVHRLKTRRKKKVFMGEEVWEYLKWRSLAHVFRSSHHLWLTAPSLVD